MTTTNPPATPRRARWHHLARVMIGLAAGSALLCAFLSSLYLSQFPYGTVVLPWEFPLWIIFPLVLAGFLLMYAIVLDPGLFWPASMATAVLTSGIVVLRFPILDEILVAAIAVAGLAVVATGAAPRRPAHPHRLWVLAFLILAGFLLLMSVVGFIVFGNAKALRYSLTFGGILLLGFLLAFYDFPRPTSRQITIQIGVLALLYYSTYLIHGLVVFRDFSYNYVLEGIGSAGVGYRDAIGIVAIPAALILTTRYRGRLKLLGWSVMMLALVVGVLGDSRGVFVYFLGGIAIAPFAIGTRPTVKVLAVMLVAATVAGTLAFERPEWVLDMKESLTSAFDVEPEATTYTYFGREVEAARGDTGRFLFTQAAVEALAHNPFYAITGVGLYGYFPIAGPHYQRLAAEGGVPTTVINPGASVGGIVEPPRPPSLGPMIVESGLLGVGLLAVCCAAAVSAAVLQKSARGEMRVRLGPNLLVAASVAFGVMSMYFGGPLDMMLFHVLYMPFGLVHSWVRPDSSQPVTRFASRLPSRLPSMKGRTPT